MRKMPRVAGFGKKAQIRQIEFADEIGIRLEGCRPGSFPDGRIGEHQGEEHDVQGQVK